MVGRNHHPCVIGMPFDVLLFMWWSQDCCMVYHYKDTRTQQYKVINFHNLNPFFGKRHFGILEDLIQMVTTGMLSWKLLSFIYIVAACMTARRMLSTDISISDSITEKRTDMHGLCINITVHGCGTKSIKEQLELNLTKNGLPQLQDLYHLPHLPKCRVTAFLYTKFQYGMTICIKPQSMNSFQSPSNNT